MDLLKGFMPELPGGADENKEAPPKREPVGTVGTLTGSDWMQSLYDFVRQFMATRQAEKHAGWLRDVAENPNYPSWLKQSWFNEGSPGGTGKHGAPQDFRPPTETKRGGV